VSETRYIYDGMRVVEERNSSNQPTARYTRGTDLSGTLEGAGGIGGLLAMSAPSSGGWSHHYYHADGNGNITAMMDQWGTLSATYRYDPYGRTINQTGPMAQTNRYRFSSKEHHEPSGLYYYGYRFYSPELQRWINRDPIAETGGINLYGFVGNDPVNVIDAIGLDIFKLQYPGWLHHEAILGNNPDTGGYWFTDFGPLGDKSVTAPGRIGYDPDWIDSLEELPAGVKVIRIVRTTPDVDKALRDRAEQDYQSIAPRFWCLFRNCRDYANNIINQAHNMMNPLITVPPSFNIKVNTPVLNLCLRP
jgi:RHS repeat-associated protein